MTARAAALKRIKDLSIRQEVLNVQCVLAFAWCLSVLGRTDFSPSADEQMPPTDITQDMRVLDVYINEVSALMRQPHP